MVSTTVGDVLELSGGSIKTGPFGTKLAASEYSMAGAPVVSVGEVGYGAIRVSKGTKRVGPEVAARLPEYVLRPGDIVFGRKGAVDRSAWVRPHENGYFLGSDGIRLRFGQGVDSRFMAYQLGSERVRNWILQHAVGTTLASLNEPTLKAVPVGLPPLDQQRAIATTLGALDDKIDSNQRAGEVSLALLDAMFEAACVLGPSVAAVEVIATFHNRRRVPLSRRQREERVGPYPYYGATGVFGFVDNFLFDENLLLVGEDGSVVNSDGTPVTQYIWGKSWINNHAHPLTGQGVSTELLFLALRRIDVRPIVTGAVQAKISMGNLKSLEVALPSGTARTQLEETIQPVMAMHRQKVDETAKLISIRDALLPELLSGRIRVPNGHVVA